MSAGKLRQRVLTALLLVPLVVVAVLWLSTPYLALCLGLILVPAAWEWAALSGLATRAGRLVYVALVALCLLLLWQPSLRQWSLYLLAAAVVFWCAVTLLLFRLRGLTRKSGPDPGMAAVGVIVLAGPWLAMVHLHAYAPMGPALVLFLLVLIWTADTLAYFTGRRWGDAKLAPWLSPGKTRIGVYGALAGTGPCGIAAGWALGLPPGSRASFVALCVLTAAISVIGEIR